MISSAKITSGYATKLPAVKDKTFEFTPGLNVLFGPNGCGKTTVLRVTAAYAGCQNRGWSTASIDELFKKPPPYPARFRYGAPGKCDAKIAWDGVPAFLHTVEVAMTGRLSNDQDEFDEQVGSIISKASTGQSVINMLGRLQMYLKSIPDLTDAKRTMSIDGETVQIDHVNDTWKDKIISFVEYVKSLPVPEVRRVTVFIDEPDNALSIPNQCLLWSKALPSLAHVHQVIVASHSPFALLPGPNTIEMTPGYVNECMDAIKALVET